MGGIIFWAIIRTAILIPVLWLLLGYMEYQHWWWLGILSVTVVIIYPASVQYRMFLEKNSEVIENTLCSSCRHFDKSAVLCLKFDEHPTEHKIPCEGLNWEPKGKNEEED
jgi:hypothetical protein